MMKKIVVGLIVFSFVLNLFLISDDVVVVAHETDDGYYMCDFEEYADGTLYLNESIDGVKWLKVKYQAGQKLGVGTYMSTKELVFDEINAPAGSTSYYFNLSENTVNINFSTYTASNNAEKFTFNIYFNKSDTSQIFRIAFEDSSGINNIISCAVWDDVDGVVFPFAGSVAGSWDSVNITLNVTTQDIHVEIGDIAGVTIADVWFPCGNFDYVDNIYFEFVSVIGDGFKCVVDDFKILSGETDDSMWDTGLNSIGNVDIGSVFYHDFDFDESDEFVFEVDYDGFYGSCIIDQVALRIGFLSDIADIDVFARVENRLLGNYDNYYSSGVWFVLVWEDVNLQTGYMEDFVLEFKAICTDANRNLYVCKHLIDIDSDGDTEYRFSDDENEYNGVYDAGTVISTRDLAYEAWFTGFDSSTEGGSESTIYFNFYDLETGNQLRLYGSDCFGLWYPNVAQARFTSDLWDFEYEKCEYDYPNTAVNVVIEENSPHWFNFSGLETDTFKGLVDGEWQVFQEKKLKVPVKDGNIVAVWFVPTDYDGENDYPNCQSDGLHSDFTWWHFVTVYMCFDKFTYDYGETINVRYKFADAEQLESLGLPIQGWMLHNYEKAWTSKLLHRWSQQLGDFYMDDEWQEMSWICNESYDYATYFMKYGMELHHDDWGTNPANFEWHTCSGDDFLAWADIISVSSPTAWLGETFEVIYASNCDGKFVFSHPSSGESHPSVFSQVAGSPNRILLKELFKVGLWRIDIFAHNGVAYEEDANATEFITVVGDSEHSGEVGYNTEYLMMETYRYIAGANDSVTIVYRTFNNDSSWLNIYTPRGEKSYFSTFVNSSGRLHKFKLDNRNSFIGEWTVVLNGTRDCHPDGSPDCIHQLNTSFNVIAEEHNWIMFTRYEFYDDELFNIKLKHDYEVGISFYKWNDRKSYYEAKGMLWRLHEGEHEREINGMPVPAEYAFPTAGKWKVKLERINDELIHYLLSEHVCSVIVRPIIRDDDNLFGGSPEYGGFTEDQFFGIMGFVIFGFILAFGIAMSRPIQSDGASFGVIGIFGIVGVLIPTVLNWFYIWMSFTICLMIIGILFYTIKKN